ncbi:MAG: hypothetical protein U5L96_04305 [Owenweeksia sp.]|nr:hypothetical protein [Owenweeksia sp.]
MQEMRFGSALQVEILVDDIYLSSKIPPLTLQLLVENAFKHNVVSRSKPLQLRIYIENDKLVVGNRLQEKSNRSPSTGYGLDSIRKKYQFYSSKKVQVKRSELAILLFRIYQ